MIQKLGTAKIAFMLTYVTMSLLSCNECSCDKHLDLPEENPNKEPPSCITGGCFAITENSAIIRCIYLNVTKECYCGLEVEDYEHNKGRLIMTDSRDSEQVISLSELEPSTTYSYWACMSVNGEFIKGEEWTFTTAPPSK